MHWPDLDNCKILTKVIFTRRPRGDRGRRRHQKRRHAEVFGMSVRAWKKRRHNSGKIFHSRIESLLFNWNNRRNHFTSYEQIYMFLKVSLAEWPMVVWLFGLTVCVWKLPKASLIIVRHTGLCTHCTLIVHSLYTRSQVQHVFQPCYLSCTNTVSCGKRPADLRVVPKSKHDNFLRGKLVTSSKRSLGYPSFCTRSTSSCENKTMKQFSFAIYLLNWNKS